MLHGTNVEITEEGRF